MAKKDKGPQQSYEEARRISKKQGREPLFGYTGCYAFTDPGFTEKCVKEVDEIMAEKRRKKK